MRREFKILLSIPKTIWFNLRYLPLRYALRLPVWLASNVRIRNLSKGCITIKGNLRLGLIRIGYHEADGVDTYSSHTIIDIERGGRLIFNSDAHIGQGSIIVVKKKGTLVLGQGFAISGTTSIICTKSITFGNDVQLSWNSLIMDSDAHRVFDSNGSWTNPPHEICIGNKVWIAANTTILKGVNIADNVIVAANSMVNRQFNEGGIIIGGQPAKILATISGFQI